MKVGKKKLTFKNWFWSEMKVLTIAIAHSEGDGSIYQSILPYSIRSLIVSLSLKKKMMKDRQTLTELARITGSSSIINP